MSQANILSVATKLSILSAFREEYFHALIDNWDGCGAKSIDRCVLFLADRILSRYATPRFLQEVSPGKFGSISFVWDDGKNYIYLDVGPKDAIHLYYKLKDGQKWEGVSLANDAIMHSQLSKAFSVFRDFGIFIQSPATPSRSILVAARAA